jgi:2-hydroxychromene-2-carboxylate isomerase
VDFRPVLLGGLFKLQGRPPVPAAAWNEAKVRWGKEDVLLWAQHWQIPLRYPASHPQRTVEAMRLIVAAPNEVRVPLSEALFEAYWVHSRDMTDRGVLGEIAARFGVDLSCIDESSVKEKLHACTAAASERGVFGVPSLFVGEQMWWGQDRLRFAERALGLPDWDSGQAHERGGVIDFYHDFSSPFSYLASTQIERIVAEKGFTVRWKPVLLGALFKAVGTANVPLFEMTELKRQYMFGDFMHWAEHWGVPFSFPSTFPIRTVLPLRVAILQPRTIAPLYQALWTRDQNIGEAEVLKQVLDDAGFSGAELIAGTQEQAIKDELRKNTEEAYGAGAFGVPSFVMDDGRMVWGQDRLYLVRRLMSGWEPGVT